MEGLLNQLAQEQHDELLVYRLYDFTCDEVLLVEPGFGLSREEYEAADPGPCGSYAHREVWATECALKNFFQEDNNISI